VQIAWHRPGRADHDVAWIAERVRQADHLILVEWDAVLHRVGRGHGVVPLPGQGRGAGPVVVGH
jgi:hypothetical protein